MNQTPILMVVLVFCEQYWCGLMQFLALLSVANEVFMIWQVKAGGL